MATARQYTTSGDDDDILTEIQHLGGATNLIDFTNHQRGLAYEDGVGSEVWITLGLRSEV